MSDQAVAQLRDELDSLAARIGAVLGGAVQLAITQRTNERAGWLVGELADGDLPDETAADLLALLYPDDPPLNWWRTPLGLLIAPTAARESDATGWSRAEAAAVLGKTPGTISQLIARGTLEQLDNGAVSRAAVLARLVRLSAPAVR